jgi:hypothetical protein
MMMAVDWVVCIAVERATFLREASQPEREGQPTQSSGAQSNDIHSSGLPSLLELPAQLPSTVKMGGGGKIPYPKHVWSPAGGWYGQPKNWKSNTAVSFAVIFGITAILWKISAEREHRFQMPEEGRFFPSR